MRFDDYQVASRKTAIYPDKGANFVYPTLGLAGESGEIAEKVKKILRDKDGEPTIEDVDQIEKELGDVLWYIAQICTELGISLADVARGNLKKLRDRQRRNALHGSGDNR